MPPGPLGGHILIKNGRTDPQIQNFNFSVFFRMFSTPLFGVTAGVMELWGILEQATGDGSHGWH